MSPSLIQRALAIAAALTILAPGLVIADTVAADGDAVTAGNQATVDLGSVAPGAVFALDVDMRLVCSGSVHAGPGSTMAVTAVAITVPDDGSLAVTPGRITVPATWPAAGEACPADVLPVTGDIPVHLAVTAPTAEGPNREFTVLFDLAPADGVSNLVAVTVVVDVVAATPADVTAPVLAGVPASISVITGGTGAAVSWTSPTATDDTDPSPQVGCLPASGSWFPVGTTTVTCTATDAASNASTASFDVTVTRLDAVFGQPLVAGQRLAVRGGRTLPLRLEVFAGSESLGPTAIEAPALRLDALASCEPGALVTVSSDGGSFGWEDGAWRLHLATGAMTAGCWRLTAVVDGVPLASAEVRVGDGSAAAGLALHRRAG